MPIHLCIVNSCFCTKNAELSQVPKVKCLLSGPLQKNVRTSGLRQTAWLTPQWDEPGHIHLCSCGWRLAPLPRGRDMGAPCPSEDSKF